MTLTPFRFRLRLSCGQAGKLAFSGSEVIFSVSDNVTLEFAARNANEFDQATNFHIDAGGFTSEEQALEAAEALRIRLRLLNAILGLGLDIPVDNVVSGQVSEGMKAKLKAENNITVVDSIWGISVYPDDGLHYEYILSGNFVVKPSDPMYLLEGLKTLWNLDVALDSASETSLHILCLATQETSDKAIFLTSYLALEQLIERKPRSEHARTQIRRFQEELAQISQSGPESLSATEVQSLTGALSALHEESFSSALTRFGKTITSPTLICGVSPQKFLSSCITARNKIAHNAEPGTKIALGELAKGLREFVLTLIWHRNNLPPFNMSTPPSAITIPESGISIRVM